MLLYSYALTRPLFVVYLVGSSCGDATPLLLKVVLAMISVPEFSSLFEPTATSSSLDLACIDAANVDIDSWWHIKAECFTNLHQVKLIDVEYTLETV